MTLKLKEWQEQAIRKVHEFGVDHDFSVVVFPERGYADEMPERDWWCEFAAFLTREPEPEIEPTESEALWVPTR